MARVSPRTIDRAIASGQLRASKVNGGRRVRIHRTWLTAWLLGSVFLVLGLCRSERVDRWCQSVKRGRYGQRLAKLAAILFSATAILFGLAYVGNWDPAQRAVMSLGFASADLGEQLQDPVEAKPAAAAEGAAGRAPAPSPRAAQGETLDRSPHGRLLPAPA